MPRDITRTPWPRRLRWRAEAFALAAALSVCRALGPVRASHLGGALARGIGPLLPASRTARRNLRLIYPERGSSERRAMLRAAWETLGRNATELPHLGDLGPSAIGPGWEILGAEHLVPLSAGGPALLISAHIGQWEILPAMLQSEGIALGSIYRAPENPVVGRLLRRWRRRASGGVALPLFPKGAAGARAALRHLSQGGVLGLLADQKMNDGLAVPFLGHLAMTPAAPAQLALRFRCPVILGRVRRIGPARFRLEVDPPLVLPETGDRGLDLGLLARAINERIGGWILDTPGDWLWFHRRWPEGAEPLTIS